MSSLPITIFHVDTPDGPADYVSCLSLDSVFSAGLPAEAILGMLRRPLEPGEKLTPDDFARNGAFVDFMHDVIARHAPEIPDLVSEARRQRDGWVYIIDQRTPTPRGSVPTEDIVGAFEVRGGDIVAGSYWRCPEHVILSSHGFFQLGTELQLHLLTELTARLG